jgi:putative transposase
MIRNYKYRLYPNKKQESTLNEILSLACWLYNRALDYKRKKWIESRKSISGYDLQVIWSDWRNENPEDNPLRLINMTAGENVIRRLDSAYRQFLKGKRGFPRFKKVSRFVSIDYKYGNGTKIKNNHLYIQNVGFIKVRWHRELPDGNIKKVIVLRKPSGWYALLQIEFPELIINKSTNKPIGIDMGLTHALVLSDGTVFDKPRYLKQSLRKLRILKRSVSRKRKGSNNQRKAYNRIARLYEHITNQSMNWWHNSTRKLVNNYGVIVVEELSIKFMFKNRYTSRSAQDVGLGMFRELLDYKAVEAGVNVVAVNPRNTSQICSGCGNIVRKDLNVRIHSCPYCGLVIDRDKNAAKNILELGRSSWETTYPNRECVSQDTPDLKESSPRQVNKLQVIDSGII